MQLYRGHKVPRNSVKSVLPKKKAIKLDMTPFIRSDFQAQKSVLKVCFSVDNQLIILKVCLKLRKSCQ